MITFARVRFLFVRHLRFVGPGLVSAVAYIDPGNWATDISAGAEYGYKLLFIVLLAGLAAVVCQLLAVRLGATTSMSLAHQTRLLFLRLEAKHPKYRIPLRCGLWFLYILAEIAVIATDLAELLGSAIALNLLFPKLPLFGGVLITAVDVLVVLFFFRSNRGRQGMLFFEILIVSLVLAVFVSFIVLLKLVKPDYAQVFLGLLPSKTLVKPGALYVGVGIIGATVMPHALFLGSSLASVDRIDMLPLPPVLSVAKSHRLPSLFKRRRSGTPDSEIEMGEAPVSTLELSRPSTLSRNGSEMNTSKNVGGSSSTLRHRKTKYEEEVEVYEQEIKSFDRIQWVDVHLFHATIDTTLSLLGFALTINASILTLAGAAFFYNPEATEDADLQGAYALIKSYIGNGAAVVFALALLCAGQSASITATLAGQVISEGFINWKTNPTLRRLITRLIGVIPSGIVASSVGAQGLNTMLVASQVVLSIVLPTVILPLVYLCSQSDVMMVEGPENDISIQPPQSTASVHPSPLTQPTEAAAQPTAPSSNENPASTGTEEVQVEPTPERRKKTYETQKSITVIGYAMFGFIVLANVYVIVKLGLGQGG